MTDTSQETGAESKTGTEEITEVETVAIPKSDYEKMNQTLGSLKRELKDLKKPKEEPIENKKPDGKLVERLDKLALNVAGIKEADEIELFNNWKEQTGREADDIVGNDIFKKELDGLRTAKANLAATSNITGENGTSGVKNNPDYWIGKATKGKDGKLEFPEETPKELYSKILDKISAGEPGSSKDLKFYNS